MKEKRIDWQEINERLSEIKKRTGEITGTTSGFENILKQRARVLSSRVPEKRSGQEIRSYLFSRISGELFGIELQVIREVLKTDGFTKVPAAPAAIRGLINLNNEIRLALDLHGLLGLEREAPTPYCLILKKNEIALPVEHPDSIAEIHLDEIKEYDGGGNFSRFLKGVYENNIILDTDKIIESILC